MPYTLSPDEKEELLKQEDKIKKNELVLGDAKTAMKKVREYNGQRKTDENLSKEIIKFAESVAKNHNILFHKKSSEEGPENLKELTKYAIESQTVETFSALCVELLNFGDQSVYPGIDEDHTNFLNTLLLFLMNSSYNNNDVSNIIAQHTCIPSTAIGKLKMWQSHWFSNNTDNNKIEVEEITIVTRLCGILHNISMFEENVGKVRSENCIDAMKPYLNSKDNDIRLLSLATIADLLHNEECKSVIGNSDVIQFLVTTLSNTMEGGNKNWSLKELSRIVQRVARNDSNKEIVVECGAVPLLVRIIASDNIDNQREATNAIWALSFDEKIGKAMIQNKDWNVMKTLKRLLKSSDGTVKTLSKNALWTINDHTKNYDKVKENRHIMISYNWGNQSLVTPIYERLTNNGLRVWMDIHDMGNDIVDGMAAAVDMADVILVCYSSGYKNSYNCRAEAKYAYKRKKVIIPLKMEKDFQDEDWLGLILSTRRYHDFSDQKDIEQTVNELSEAIQKELKILYGTVVNGPKTTRFPAAKPTADLDSILSWTQNEVKKWLDKNRLLKETESNQLQQSRLVNLRGNDIVFLKLLVRESPNTFYETIKEQLQLHDLQSKADFRLALEKLCP